MSHTPSRGRLFSLVFADANLEQAIFDLAIAEGYTYASQILSLSAIGSGIADLGGIEELTNLQAPYLSDISISDVTPLSGLTFLSHVSLNNNKITTGVAELVTLTEADLINFAGNPDISSVDLDTLETALPDTGIELQSEPARQRGAAISSAHDDGAADLLLSPGGVPAGSPSCPRDGGIDGWNGERLGPWRTPVRFPTAARAL